MSKLNEKPNQVEYMKLIQELFPKHLKESRDKFESEGNHKGVGFSDKILLNYYQLLYWKDQLTDMENDVNVNSDNVKRQEIIDNLEFYSKESKRLTREFSEYLKTTKVLTEMNKINTKLGKDDLDSIDIELNNFLISNHQETLSEYFGLYPESLIIESKRQLDRVSINYGGRVSKLSIDEDITVDFPTTLFLKLKNYQLFEYFIEHFGYSKRPVDLSQIYRWMENNGKLKSRSGIEFREFTVSKKLVNGAFSKIASINPNSQTAINELFKKYPFKD